MLAKKGFTLVEMVAVITILGIVGMVSSYVIFESTKVYARTLPWLDASYQCRLAVEQMKSELRDLEPGSLTTFTPIALTFQLLSGQPLTYSLAGSNLLRNGDLLAKGVQAFSLTYRKRDGTSALIAADVHLLELDLTVQAGGQTCRVQTAVFPRSLRP